MNLAHFLLCEDTERTIRFAREGGKVRESMARPAVGFFMGEITEGNAGKRILIVDDEKAIRDFLSDILIHWGYQVTVAGSGSEALPLFLRTSFGLVLTDLNMPGIDGWSVAVHVKDTSPNTLVGLMTGQNTEDLIKKLEGSCVDFLLFKPFTLEELGTQLRRYCAEGQGNEGQCYGASFQCRSRE